ncbi:MAG: sigma-70 family RNA polymerase sigma factor [Gemmatimonadetes bacterium]|nr:sigma-70 family RNA polymerase sigma factor [Gemmatimonadota bacterium]
MDAQHRITELTVELRDGDPAAWDHLLPLVYDELRRIARRHIRRQRGGLTLNTTALVHEAYLKLVDQTRVPYADRAHFFSVASRAMRQVLIDYARRHRAAKRGGEWQRVPLDEAEVAVEERAGTLLALDEALTRLAEMNERLVRVVECRFFGGLTEEETAVALGVTDRTVRRDWTKARMWLYGEIRAGVA